MRSVPVWLFHAALLAAAIGAVSPAAAATGPAPAAAAKTAAGERAALMALDAHFSDEVATKGFAAFEGFFADDATYLPTFEPRVEGKKAIMESFRPLFDDHTLKLTWIPLRAEVAASGDLGWTTGSYELTRLDEQGAAHVRRGKYVTIWRRQADGSWKAVLDGGNPDAPPPAPAPATPPAAPPAARP